MHWLWSKLGKILGGLLLFGGGTVSAGLLVGIFASHAAGVGLAVMAMLLVFFGVSPLLLGGWLLQSGFRAEQRAIREHFFRLLHLNQGRLSVLDFSAATRLEPTIARRHLDEWAREFAAEFEVNDRGEIHYVFAKELLPLPESNWQPLAQAIRQWLQASI
jgi:hypothetical protein